MNLLAEMVRISKALFGSDYDECRLHKGTVIGAFTNIGNTPERLSRVLCEIKNLFFFIFLPINVIL